MQDIASSSNVSGVSQAASATVEPADIGRTAGPHEAQKHMHGHPLFEHAPHPHVSRNANRVHAAEKAAGNFNQKVAVGMTNVFQAMPTFWLIAAWIVLWILSNATILRFDPLPWPLLLTLASVPQLPLMIVIMVGQGLLGRHAELISEEQFNTTMNTYHDTEQVMQHLSAQDAELLKQTSMLIKLLETQGISLDKLTTEYEAAQHGAKGSAEPDSGSAGPKESPGEQA